MASSSNLRTQAAIVSLQPSLSSQRMRTRSTTDDPECLRVVQDDSGMCCSFCTYMLILYAFLIHSMYIIGSSYYDGYYKYVLFAILLLAGASHARASFSNPGVVEYDAEWRPDVMQSKGPVLHKGELMESCVKCLTFRPLRSHHCSVCQSCIRLMDHHCVWINNCVGEWNRKYFLLFVMYILIGSVFSFFLLFRRLYYCVSLMDQTDDGHEEGEEEYYKIIHDDCERAGDPFHLVLICFLATESLLFLLFTGFMFFDQLRSILVDHTGIEEFKSDSKLKESDFSNMKIYFGKPSWRWMLPLAPFSRRRSSSYNANVV